MLFTVFGLCPSLDFFKLKLKDFFGVNVYFKSCIWLQFIQINNGAVELEPSVMGAQPNSQASTRKVKVPLNSRYCWCCFRLICPILCQSFGMCLTSSIWGIVIWYQLSLSDLCSQWQAVQGASRSQLWSRWPGNSFVDLYALDWAHNVFYTRTGPTDLASYQIAFVQFSKLSGAFA